MCKQCLAGVPGGGPRLVVISAQRAHDHYRVPLPWPGSHCTYDLRWEVVVCAGEVLRPRLPDEQGARRPAGEIDPKQVFASSRGAASRFAMEGAEGVC